MQCLEGTAHAGALVSSSTPQQCCASCDKVLQAAINMVAKRARSPPQFVIVEVPIVATKATYKYKHVNQLVPQHYDMPDFAIRHYDKPPDYSIEDFSINQQLPSKSIDALLNSLPGGGKSCQRSMGMERSGSFNRWCYQWCVALLLGLLCGVQWRFALLWWCFAGSFSKARSGISGLGRFLCLGCTGFLQTLRFASQRSRVRSLADNIRLWHHRFYANSSAINSAINFVGILRHCILAPQVLCKLFCVSTQGMGALVHRRLAVRIIQCRQAGLMVFRSGWCVWRQIRGYISASREWPIAGLRFVASIMRRSLRCLLGLRALSEQLCLSIQGMGTLVRRRLTVHITQGRQVGLIISEGQHYVGSIMKCSLHCIVAPQALCNHAGFVGSMTDLRSHRFLAPEVWRRHVRVCHRIHRHRVAICVASLVLGAAALRAIDVSCFTFTSTSSTGIINRQSVVEHPALFNLFNKCDRDNNELLYLREFGRCVIRLLGKQHKNFIAANVKPMMSELDVDKSGTIDLAEWIPWAAFVTRQELSHVKASTITEREFPRADTSRAWQWVLGVASVSGSSFFCFRCLSSIRMQLQSFHSSAVIYLAAAIAIVSLHYCYYHCSHTLRLSQL